MNYKIPDLRFEQTFNASLTSYAYPQTASVPQKPTLKQHALTDEELQESLPPIPVLVVLYAVVKDQIVLPLILGFVWTSVLMVCGPILWQLTRHGQRCGLWLANVLRFNGGPPSFLKPVISIVRKP